jgi:hypothetical protein
MSDTKEARVVAVSGNAFSLWRYWLKEWLGGTDVGCL